ncbi:hypothetical protein SEUCBS140593_008808 [Sporothrix eucalyptigena]|uniref:NAD(P)-binding protein n=1 Tax=Sporothrix eucalyptigena TaxID=1812306 RepID=A0ABP0CPJ2_9PEZI
MSSAIEKAKEIAEKVTGQENTGEGDKTKYSSSFQHPAQSQKHPGLERDLDPRPVKAHLPTEDDGYQLYSPAGKLQGKRALITGGDSGIGRAVAILYAMEGASVAITYLPDELEDALHTKTQVEKNSGTIHLIAKDLRSRNAAQEVIEQAVSGLGGFDILVNNAAYELEQEDISNISEEQYLCTIETNLTAPFFLSKHALRHMGKGSSIINTVSVDAYVGPPSHLDYSVSKGGLVSFTRTLANQQARNGIRVNAVAPGPIWTPFIPAAVSKESQKSLPDATVMKRFGQPVEVATSFVFLAAQDSSYMTGQVLHPNGGMAVVS